MNLNEALLQRLDKIVEKMESLENVISGIDLKLQRIVNTNDQNEVFGLTNNLNVLSSSSSTSKLDSDHSWNLSTDMKYRQGITPDQRRRDNRQANLYRSSSPSQGSGISVRQIPSYTQNDLRRSTKPSRPSSTDGNSKTNASNITANTNINNNLNDNKKKTILTNQKSENKIPSKVETPPPPQLQPSIPAKPKSSVVFFPDDNEDDLQFDED